MSDLKLEILAGNKGFDPQVTPEEAHYSWMCLLQKWLREKHGIEVWVSPFLYDGFMEDGTYNFTIYSENGFESDGVEFDTFQDALKEGLTEALKLI